jgi:flavodoxin/Pyruvate/2-oxoacid:ferredoxin oxidoreductase delta subunit
LLKTLNKKKFFEENIVKIGIIYFSATGITEAISNHIGSILEREGHSTDLKNIIAPESRETPIDFKKFDAFIFGFPVFGGRPPTVAEEWMRTLEGKKLKCSMFFTYGARDLEWAHQVTYYLLSQANFQLVLSAEFIGKHSFSVGKGWSLAEDRPNQSDLEIATEFALKSINRFQKDTKFTIDLSGFRYEPRVIKEILGEWANVYPSRVEDDCSMCYLCENECPVKAFDAKSGNTNRNLCITCMHCVTICPDHVIQIGDVSQIVKDFLQRTGLTEEVVAKKRSKIIY